MIYLDHLSTTRLDPRVWAAMQPYFLEHWGSPHSPGKIGDLPAEALETARRSVASLLGAKSEEIIFNSSSAEGVNHAIKGFFKHPKVTRKHILASPVANLSLIHPLRQLEKEGFELQWLSVDGTGRLDPEDLKVKLRDDTALVALGLCCFEVGTLHPVEEIGALVSKSDAALFIDATLGPGLLDVGVANFHADFLTLSAHHFHGPKGAGVLFHKSGLPLLPLIEGGIEESGYRAGMENLPAIVGMGEAARFAKEELPERSQHLESLSKILRKELGEIEGIHFTGHPENRLPGHVSFSAEGVDGEALLIKLDQAGVSASSGSVCASQIGKASHALEAMGLSKEQIKGSLVFSAGKDTTEEDVKKAVEILRKAVGELRDLGI